MYEVATAKKFQFIGNNLALDFCNTVGGKRGVVDREYLNSPLNYIGWCQQAGILDESLARKALARAEREPEKSEAIVKRAVELREAVFRIFEPSRRASPPAAADLALLNYELSQALCRLRLTPAKNGEGMTWEWMIDCDCLDQPLGPIAHAAATLLTDPHALAHVRICHGEQCGW